MVAVKKERGRRPHGRVLCIGVEVRPSIFFVKFPVPDIQGKKGSGREFRGGCLLPVRLRKVAYQGFRIDIPIAKRLPCQAEAGDHIGAGRMTGIHNGLRFLYCGGKILIFRLEFP